MRRPLRNDRDERGWRVPRAGTRSRAIYDMLILGHTPAYIHSVIGGNLVAVRVLIWKIRNPGDANGWRRDPA